MEKGKKKLYTPLSHIERWIPIVFLVAYLMLGMHAIFFSLPAAMTPRQVVDQLQQASPGTQPSAGPSEKK